MIRHLGLCCLLLLIMLGCRNRRDADEQPAEPDTRQVVDQSTWQAPARLDDLVQQPESEKRDDWQNPDVVMQPLAGKVVADIGAGTGYFSLLLAQEGASVIAIDINEAALDYIKEHLNLNDKDRSLAIETRLTRADSIALRPAEVDQVLLVNTYPYLRDRISYLKQVMAGLKRGGHIMIIDFKEQKEGGLPIGDVRKLPAITVKKELSNAGFTEIVTDSESLPYQYIIMAQTPN